MAKPTVPSRGIQPIFDPDARSLVGSPPDEDQVDPGAHPGDDPGSPRPGQSLSAGVVRREEGGLLKAGLRVWGSWRAALRAAGAPPPRGTGRPPLWTREAIIDRIRREARAPLRTWRTNLLRRTGGIYEAGVRVFGSWRRALLAAGIDPSRGSKWTREGAARAIRQRWRETGSSAMWIVKGEWGLTLACRRLFGGWRGAARAAGIPPPPHGCRARKWTRERILREMRREIRERPGDWRSHIQRRRMSIYKAARKLFGSWHEAVRRAGGRRAIHMK